MRCLGGTTPEWLERLLIEAPVSSGVSIAADMTASAAPMTLR